MIKRYFLVIIATMLLSGSHNASGKDTLDRLFTTGFTLLGTAIGYDLLTSISNAFIKDAIKVDTALGIPEFDRITLEKKKSLYYAICLKKYILLGLGTATMLAVLPLIGYSGNHIVGTWIQ